MAALLRELATWPTMPSFGLSTFGADILSSGIEFKLKLFELISLILNEKDLQSCRMEELKWKIRDFYTLLSNSFPTCPS